MITLPKATIFVAPVSDHEIPICFQATSESFGHDAPFFDIYFPNHDTSSGQAEGSKRLIEWKQAEKNSTFLKAVTTAQDGQGDWGQPIIGFAIWTHMKEAPPAELGKAEANADEIWPDGDDREFMARMWREYVIPRTKAIEGSGGKGVYVLEMLAVRPGYRRLGAGTALVEWGTKAADEQGLQAIVEATAVGRRLYEQCGLRAEIEEMRFDVGEEFSGRRIPKLVFLKREPRS